MSARARYQLLLIGSIITILFLLISRQSSRQQTVVSSSRKYDEFDISLEGGAVAWKAADTSATTTNMTVTVVVPRLKSEDVSWLHAELPQFQTAVYVVDDQSAPLHPPKNKGNEAMVYLSYVIDSYDTLPDISIFIHAHRWAWHNSDVMDNDMATLLQRLNLDYVQMTGYTNLRCQSHPGCPDYLHPRHGLAEHPAKKEEALIAEVWPLLFPNDELPSVLAQPCCSQFAVARERILSRPKIDYERLRNWLLQTKIRNSMSGRIFEYIWQVLFTGESVVCPSERACHCNMYGLCFEDDDSFDDFIEIRSDLKTQEWVAMDWEEVATLDPEASARERTLIALGQFKLDAIRLEAFERGKRLRETRITRFAG